jgi:glutamyl-tRNA synthetase
MSAVRLRLPPSPTGFPHLGTFRTAVFNYLFAKQHGGALVLRIEDTDRAREVEGSVQYIAEALNWLGIAPEEGVYLAEDGTIQERGAFGPYTQSKRLPIYQEYVAKLLASGDAYYCFATSEELDQMRSEQQARGELPRYDGRYRDFSPEEAKQRVAAGESYVIRHKIPHGLDVSYVDVVRDELTVKSDTIEDYILMKSDGFPTYHLANVVDDHLMEITHVLRGDEWMPSTPKHILLYKAFGWEPPTFGHLPVILGPDGRHKLSKRDGAQSTLEYRDQGYLPEALVNALAFLGWSPGTEEEFFTLQDLVERFKLDKVQRAGAVFNLDRINYVNGWYIRQLMVPELVHRLLPFWQKAGLVDDDGHPIADFALPCEPEMYLQRMAALVQDRLKHLDEVGDFTRFMLRRPEVTAELQALLVPKKSTPERVQALLRGSIAVLHDLAPEAWYAPDHLEAALRAHIAAAEASAMEVLWPIRAALSGESASPGTFELLVLFGRDESLQRLGAVLAE